jgi:hypothetical protein
VREESAEYKLEDDSYRYSDFVEMSDSMTWSRLSERVKGRQAR